MRVNRVLLMMLLTGLLSAFIGEQASNECSVLPAGKNQSKCGS